MLIDIHILQNHAPSNLNRDDTGAPKDAVFGGFSRARISSQCLKRSIRRSDVFRDAFAAEGLLARRTQLFPQLLRERLEAMGAPGETVEAIARRAPEFGRESTKPPAAGEKEDDKEERNEQQAESKTAQLIFLSDAELDSMARKLVELYDEVGDKAFAKLKIDEITRRLGPSAPRSVDIAMFGRMTTSGAFQDVQAAVQVAHALSTHRVEQEFDYYTAVDDISGESGAGFIGDTEFNSATYYKYFSVHWDGLVRNLQDEAIARRAVQALIEAAATVQPTGKQNSFAAHNLPDLVMVEVRERNLPVSYTNAFLKPVYAGSTSLMEASIKALSSYVAATGATYGLGGERAYIATADGDVEDATRLPTLQALLEWLPTGKVLEAA